MLHEALSSGGARAVLFVDSDVALFRNPYRALQEQPSALRHPAHYQNYDIQFQGELACDASHSACASGLPPSSCHLNGGVLLVRSAQLVAAVIAREPPFNAPLNVSSGGYVLDQDVAEDVVRSSAGRFSACALPPHAFVGFCMWAWGYNKGNRSHFDHLDPCAIVSYHAHCISQSADKLASMQRMANKTAHCVGRGGAGIGRGVIGMWAPRPPPNVAKARNLRRAVRRPR